MFAVVTPCTTLNLFQNFGGVYFVLPQGDNLCWVYTEVIGTVYQPKNGRVETGMKAKSESFVLFIRSAWAKHCWTALLILPTWADEVILHTSLRSFVVWMFDATYYPEWLNNTGCRPLPPCGRSFCLKASKDLAVWAQSIL